MTEATADGITVRRCVVRVVRRGGWSWGPDPQDLARRFVDALPELLPDLLADRFAGQLAGDGPDVVITEPVSVTVRLGAPPGRGDLPLADLVVEQASGPAPPAAPVLTEDARPAVSALTARPSTPGVLVTELAERGELAALLALLPDETLRVYLVALLEDLTWRAPPHGDTVMAALAAELTRRHPAEPLPAGDDLLRLARSLPGPPPGTDHPADPAPGEAGHLAADALPSTRQAVPAPGPAAQPGEPLAVGQTRVCPALPFLLAGPLARIGYLDAIGPALAGVDLLAEAPLFAAALAYKVMAAPERGWRRTAAADEAAAAFAGLREVPDLSGFADRVRPALPVLDGVLALSLCRGHEPADPLLVSGVDGGLLLVDALGVFPIAWAPDVAGLLPHWVACGRPDVVVCESRLPPTSLRDLAEAGVGLVTGIRPLRGDPLTRLPRPTPLWTAGHPDSRLAAEVPAHTGRLDELVRELVVARRAVPRAADRALDRSAALAASLSLGLISWTLWRAREATTPVLALTRFADLEATVRFEPDAVQVRLPLGRRHADLLRHGALTEVSDVVWLGGRTLTFSGG